MVKFLRYVLAYRSSGLTAHQWEWASEYWEKQYLAAEERFEAMESLKNYYRGMVDEKEILRQWATILS